jgi:hypothetical protein
MSLLGEIAVLAAGDEPRVIEKIHITDPPCRSTIVAAHGRLYVRTARTLYCVGVNPPPPPATPPPPSR